ncbi:MAG: NUDIX hydrolase [Clostridiales bacterium]|nr:NUDIX hydrolase [Clostridiales bacterium]
MKLFEETIEREDIFSGRVVKLHRDRVLLENGKTSIREVIDHPGGVSVAVLTEENELLFVRQFRYPYHEVVLELPAGKLEPGEDPFLAVQREQMEETGTTGKNYVYLGEVYPTPGYTSEILRLWACRAESFGESRPDEGEFLEVERIPAEKALDMVMQGEIKDAKTQIGILKVSRLLAEGKL